MTYRDDQKYQDNNNKRAGRFATWGLVAVLLVGGLILWGYRANNDPSQIEPAAGDARIESNTGTARAQEAPLETAPPAGQ